MTKEKALKELKEKADQAWSAFYNMKMIIEVNNLEEDIAHILPQSFTQLCIFNINRFDHICHELGEIVEKQDV